LSRDEIVERTRHWGGRLGEHGKVTRAFGYTSKRDALAAAGR
jgi:hypothetical protein